MIAFKFKISQPSFRLFQFMLVQVWEISFACFSLCQSSSRSIEAYY